MAHPNRVKFIKNRYSDVSSIGIELGVARGVFSKQILESCPKTFLYSVDAWAGDRHHNEKEMQFCQNSLEPFFPRSYIIQSYFSDLVNKFPNEFFDFIYIDGYAHTGQNQGSTLHEWFPKLKKGGIFSGHDYHKKWPKTMAQVDAFSKEHKLEINIITDSPYDSWWMEK